MKVKRMAVAGYESKSRSGCRLNRALGTFKFISLAPFQSRVTNLESCAWSKDLQMTIPISFYMKMNDAAADVKNCKN